MENSETIRAVQRMQDYIEQHLTEPINLYSLARTAGYSPWYSARIFKEMTGKSPFDYIRALRLSRAAIELREKKTRVVDVAFDFVFDSHEGFTRAFTRQFGVSPREYSRNHPEIRLFMPARTSRYYLEKQKGASDMTEKLTLSPVFVQVVERPERNLILKRGQKATHYYQYCEEMGCDVYSQLSQIKDALYEPVGMWLPPKLVRPGTSIYVQGVEMPRDYRGPVPEGFEMINLTPCKMMVFQGPPFDEDKWEDAISDIWELMKKYDPRLYGFEWADDDGPRFQMEPRGYRGYIEARPVRQVNV
ncbi:MAG TPA: AraC family transcriptional regulator [Dehalococcoidales bacterium]|nr:AraC family transcriptional regulator [Dehalococcoidales bacterium]